jgi:hypothetical protein
MLKLMLHVLQQSAVMGIYVINGIKNKMPIRALFLHPLAASSFMADLAMFVVCSDILRTPEASLKANREGRGAQPPGFSLHNFGIAIDIDVKATMKNLGLKTKQELDEWMEARGWYCHRRDHKMDHECWHYNYLRAFTELDGVPLVISSKVKSTAGYGEALIVRLYGDKLKPTDKQCQEMLASLKMYSGKIDGDIGDLSKEAIRVFSRAWGLPEATKMDARFRRTLALVSAERVLM